MYIQKYCFKKIFSFYIRLDVLVVQYINDIYDFY